jgi:protocatechuate 3,4-dioxygenase beta subunit
MFSSIPLVFALLLQVAGTISSQRPESAPAQQPQTAVAKQPPGSITGLVVSQTGELVYKAEVIARRVDSRDMSGTHTVTTDRSGVFTVSGLDPGRYMLSVRKAGFVEQQYGAARGSRMGTTLRLGPGQELTAITIKLTPHAVIAGKVTDEDGEPIMHSNVQAMQQRYMRGRRQWMPVANAQVNDLGEYRLAGLPPGRYIVAVSPQRMPMMRGGGGPRARGAANTAGAAEENYITTYYPSVHDLAEAMPVEVTSGGETRSIDLRLRKARTYRISGKISDVGKPGPNTMVMVVPVNQDAFGFMGRNMAPVRTEDGAFDVGGVLPGTYLVIAQRMAGPNERSMGRQEVTVGNDDVEGVVLNMTSGFEVSGTVQAEGNTKIATENLRVMLEPQSMMMFPMGSGPGTVSADGTFKMQNVAAERYRVNVFPQTDSYVKTVRVGNQEMKDGIVDLTNGAAGPIEVVLSTDGATVDGTIQDSKSRPTPGVVVALVPDAPNRDKFNLYRNATTDTAGAFSFKAIPPGSYKVFAWEEIEDAGWMDPAILARYENEGKSLSLKEGGQERFTMRFIAPETGSRLEREADEREKSTEPK